MPRLLTTITTTNTPQRLTGANTLFSYATFYGFSGFNNIGSPVNNQSGIYLGVRSGELFLQINSGSSYNMTLFPRQQVSDLSNFWINGNANDGVYVFYHA